MEKRLKIGQAATHQDAIDIGICGFLQAKNLLWYGLRKRGVEISIERLNAMTTAQPSAVGSGKQMTKHQLWGPQSLAKIIECGEYSGKVLQMPFCRIMV